MSSENQKTTYSDPTNQQEALVVLVQGLALAQKRGTYSIEESALLAKAINLFKPKENVEKAEKAAAEALKAAENDETTETTETTETNVEKEL